jgi:murein DD-endopeptidase MepM/ murein hydrolase activator NlpD
VRAALAATLLLAVGTGGAAAGQTPSSARAWAVRILVPGSPPTGTSVVTGLLAGKPEIDAQFAFPDTGAVVRTGQARAAAANDDTSASASSTVGRVSVFGGEVTARTINGTARAGQTSADFHGTGVVGLRVHGKPVAKRVVALAHWGRLAVGRSGVTSGANGFHSFVTALDITLTASHGGLPAGTEIQLGHADLSLPEAPAPALTPGPHPGDRPQLLPRVTGPLVGVPQIVTPDLGPGPFVYPVYGASSYVDGYGAGSGIGYQHGDDIAGQLGQPLLAVASGTLFSLGWDRAAGNRVWLRDRQGNLFYYANLAAFSTNARNGSRVKAGEVIGFMGNTGSAEGTGTHLHFEVHPVSLIYLGGDGAVDPTTYLASWRHLHNLPFPVATGWSPAPVGASHLPLPGALLIGATDIATGGIRAGKP